jgi:hypothetical protein
MDQNQKQDRMGGKPGILWGFFSGGRSPEGVCKNRVIEISLPCHQTWLGNPWDKWSRENYKAWKSWGQRLTCKKTEVHVLWIFLLEGKDDWVPYDRIVSSRGPSSDRMLIFTGWNSTKFQFWNDDIPSDSILELSYNINFGMTIPLKSSIFWLTTF